MIVGVDTGGTFTDVIRRDPDDTLRVYKLLSTPEDPSRAIGQGVSRIVDAGAADDPSLPDVVHGTTVATNALLERRGARVAFVTTAGFEDLLALQRQNRPDLYSLEIDRPEPLVSPDDCFGLEERVRYDGTVLEEPSSASIDSLIEALEQNGYRAVAICLLHGYANPSHEERLAECIAEELSDVHVSTGSDVVGVFREYERASTTCVNAYVAPVMEEYLDQLRTRVDATSIQVMQSSGGRTGVDHASRYPVHTVLSGPAGGVVGARAAGRELGVERIMSLDMGGTSADVSLCDGELELTAESRIDGLPVHVPVVDIHTVGAGGGSVAYADPGGGLRVGPRSAGAEPGPACYGRGGTEPTVTDAHLVLGRIRPGHFLGGRMQLDPERARQAVGELGQELGLGYRETARGILEVADVSMKRALEVISMERGHDPRRFTLVAFGGAGPLHACRLADALEIRRVVVPRNPGLLSAYGVLHADLQRSTTRSILRPVEEFLDETDELRRTLESMRGATVGTSEDAADAFDYQWTAELRYEGQSFELDVPVDWSVDAEAFDDPRSAFEREHERRYGYRAEKRVVELVALRLTASQPGPEPQQYRQISLETDREVREPKTADVGFAGGSVETAILDRRSLEDGRAFEGPAVVTEYSGTTIVPPAWRGRRESGHLVLTRGGPGS